MKNERFFLIFLILIFLFFIPTIIAGEQDKTPVDTSDPVYEDTFAEGSIPVGFKLLFGKKLAIRAPDNICHSIINSGSKSYFVPTKTQNEWISFLTFLSLPSSSLSITNCKERILQIINEYEAQYKLELPKTVKEAALTGEVHKLPSAWDRDLALTMINLAGLDEGIRLNNQIATEGQKDFNFITGVDFYSYGTVIEEGETGEIIYPPYPYGNYGSDWPSDPYFYPDPGSEEYNNLEIRLNELKKDPEFNSYEIDSIKLLLRFSDEAAVIKTAKTESANLESAKEVNIINAQRLSENIENDAYNPNDPDGDGWTTQQEIEIFGTDPDSADSAPVGSCFTAETLVKTLNEEEEISKLKVGDKVLSYNSNNNQFVYSQIEKLLVHKYNTNWYYLIKTANSQVEVTNVHPFYIGNGLYAKIENLNVGDKIYVNINGKLVQEEILSKERVNLPKLITVYNLELNEDGPRNYFANDYLVHNGNHYPFLGITGKVLVDSKD